MVSKRVSLVWIGLLLLVGTLACSGREAVDPQSADEAAQAGSDKSEGDAPDFTLMDLAGQSVSLADSSGQVRLIDFWATWCAPCREEIPMFNDLQQIYGDKGLQILAIADAGETADVIQEFAEEHGVGYTNLIGTEDISARYGVYGLPTAFLVNGEGKIVKRYFGPKPRKVLETEIRELLELPPLG